MVYVTDTESWQRIFQLAAENSRWDLTDPDVARYMERSYDFIIDFLRRVDYSEPYALDPAGDDALRLAKEVRRASRKAGMEFRMAEEATGSSPCRNRSCDSRRSSSRRSTHLLPLAPTRAD